MASLLLRVTKFGVSFYTYVVDDFFVVEFYDQLSELTVTYSYCSIVVLHQTGIDTPSDRMKYVPWKQYKLRRSLKDSDKEVLQAVARRCCKVITLWSFLAPSLTSEEDYEPMR